MLDIPSFLMIAPSAASLCCTAGTSNQRSLRGFLPAGIMLFGMVLATLPDRDDINVLVAAALIFLTVPVAIARPAGGAAASPHQAHRAVSAIFMSALLIVGLRDGGPMPATMQAGPMPGMTDLHAGLGSHESALLGFAILMLGAYFAFSIWLSIWTARTHQRRAASFEIGEISSMALMVAVMLAMA